MGNSNLVGQAFWAIAVVVIVVSFGFIVYLVYINRGSEQSYMLIKPVLGGLGIALFFIFSYLFSPLPQLDNTTDILLLTQDKANIVPIENWTVLRFGPQPSSGYFHIYGENLGFKSNLSKEKAGSVSMGGDSYFLELVEWSTLTWIAQNYPMHWQIERSWFSGISGGGGSISAAKDADKETIKIAIDSLLKNNRFAEEYKKRTKSPLFIYLPKDTKMKYKKLINNFRSFIIENKHIYLELSFSYKGGGSLGATHLAEKIKEKAGTGWSHHISVRFKMRPQRIRRWSPLTKKQGEWIRNLSAYYNESFSWYILRDKLEKVLLKGE